MSVQRIVANQNLNYVCQTILHVRPCSHGPTGVRRHEPVTAGIPLPRAVCYEPGQLAVFDENENRLLLQAEVLDRWPDRSIRWVLLDMSVRSPGALRLAILDRAQPPSETPAGLRLARDGGRITVHAGPLSMDVAPSDACLLAIQDGRGMPLERRVSLTAINRDGTAASVRIQSVREETTGPLRAVLLVEGTIGLEGCTLLLEMRLHFFASLPVVRLETSIRNTRRAMHRNNFWELGDPGSAYFRDVSVRIDVSEPPARTLCYAERESAPIITSSPIVLYQDSSGGANWQSSVHVNREGRVPHRFRGYRLDGATVRETGFRATPIMLIEHSDTCTAACVRHFWQNFPKAIETDERGLTVRLFPQQFNDLHELQGGEQKTHIVGLAFGPDSVGELPLSWILEPSVMTATPEWYAACEAVPYLAPAADPSDSGYEALVRLAIEGEDSFEQKRERIDEYGWRNFGELYADHEAVGHASDRLLVSHYNNQYDAIAGFAIQFMRSGDLRWWTSMEELAGHVVDIDLYRTSEDKAAYSGGLFWHTAHYTDAGKSTHRTYPSVPGTASGGPGNEHNYTTGLLLHYFLTGRTASREAVIQLAEWVLAIDDGRRTVFRWLTRSATGLASSTRSTEYHGPGRGAGHSIAALLNAYRLTSERRYLDKAEALIHRCIHPADDHDALTLLDAEGRWSYTVFLQVLGKYLDEKVRQGALDGQYAYARASLLHYARWMAAHEYPYLEKPDILEYPTETWAAQDIRKSEVLAVAAKYADVTDRPRLLERADFFFTQSIVTLLESPTRTFTRPLVIMLSNGYTHRELQRLASSAPAPPPSDGCFGVPTLFIPQKTLAKRRAALLAATTLLMLLTLGLALLLA